MRCRALTLILGTALLLTACTPPSGNSVSGKPADDVGMITKEVRDADAVRNAALEAGDIDAYLASYMEDAVWIPPHSQEVIGHKMARIRASEVMKQVSVQEAIDTREQVVMAPDWVLDRGRYNIQITPVGGGEVRYDSGPFLTVWHKDEDGKWKVAFDMWGSKNPLVE